LSSKPLAPSAELKVTGPRMPPTVGVVEQGFRSASYAGRPLDGRVVVLRIHKLGDGERRLAGVQVTPASNVLKGRNLQITTPLIIRIGMSRLSAQFVRCHLHMHPTKHHMPTYPEAHGMEPRQVRPSA
jgi:hypothetical protein